MKIKHLYLIIILFLIFCFGQKLVQREYQEYVKNIKNNEIIDFSETNNYQNKINTIAEIKNFTSEENIINVTVNKPTPLSYKTKQEILNLRKKYVKESIFNIQDYEPSEEVFGEIQDNKPWISTKECKYKSTGKADIDGPSEESRFINNPTLLVSVDYVFWGYPCEELEAGKSNGKGMPHTITYNKEKNEITAIYKNLRFCTPSNKIWYEFGGLNARDLGYNYMSVDKEKSNFNFKFIEDINATNSPIRFQDLIHVGGACRHESGCNNSSPNQPALSFLYPCGEKFMPDREIYIKLWREKPTSVKDKADITEKIIIQRTWE